MKRRVCIHGHFYQPPRENPWLEEIELQESAAPFHDWNERITSECYGPNASSRLLDQQGHIVDIVNNYARISFNFGPTLLSWLERNASAVYEKILEADRKSLAYFNGHGSALAQVYNHAIMPLCSEQDKRLQIRWGLQDFENRFGRKAEGMWLAETAVDIATLEALADEGVAFTILAPHQAARVKKFQDNTWTDLGENELNTGRMYRCFLPSGRSIDLFFYDGKLSQHIAFGGLLKDGRLMARELMQAVPETGEAFSLSHCATDGETFGHHHRHGEMALTACLHEIQHHPDFELCNYASYRAEAGSSWQVEIVEQSSWSCSHGIGRWKEDCGCHTGLHAHWNQKWRSTLRDTIQWLRTQADDVFYRVMALFSDDAASCLLHYHEVIANRSESNANRFSKEYCGRELSGADRTRFIRLLEMQRNALLMQTSCGWFFDDVSGIESLQIMRYADRCIQLIENESEHPVLHTFLSMLSQATSNLADMGTASDLYRMHVSPSRLTLTSVGMHFAAASLFAANPESLTICNYYAEGRDFERIEAGVFRLSMGIADVHSLVTYSDKRFSFAALYLGQNQILGYTDTQVNQEQGLSMRERLASAFSKSRMAEVISIMQEYFSGQKFSLDNLLPDERRRILISIVQQDVNLAEDSYKKIYNRSYNLLTELKLREIQVPDVLRITLDTVLNNEIRDFFVAPVLYPARLEKLADEAMAWSVPLRKDTIAFAAANRLLKVMQEFDMHPADERPLEIAIRILQVLNKLSIDLDVWQIQNSFFYTLQKVFGSSDLPSAQEPNMLLNSKNEQILALASLLNVKINPPQHD